MMRGLVGVSLCLALSACPSTTEPRPFGVESSTVTVPHGSTVVVGFRLPPTDGGMAPALTVTPPGVLHADLLSMVPEDDAYAGGLFLSADFATTPGEYVVTLGAQTITATVSEIPPANNSVQTTRRSTVAQLDHPYIGVGQLSVLTEDGTVWKLLPDGGAGRVEGLSGIRAIAGGPNETLVVASFDSPVIDVRSSQGGTVELLADGTTRRGGFPALQGVTAVRPTFFGGPSQATLVLAVTDDGRVTGGPTLTSQIRGAIDVIPGGQTFLRSDGVVYDTTRNPDGPAYSPVFAFAGMRAFDGSTYETFSAQTAEFRHHALWATPDGLAWFMRSDKNPEPLLAPEGVTFIDVFARGRGAYALGDNKRLYDVTSGVPVLLPFENVRSSTPKPDVGVFSDAIAMRPGQSVVVPLRVVREGYDGALLLTPRTLPADVTAAPVSIPAQATTASLTVTFAATGVARPLTLEFALTGEGLARTTTLSVEMAPSTHRITVAKDIVLKADGTVWRLTATAATQLPGLTNIISVADNLALDAQGVVYSFGDNSLGQLGRVTMTANDPTPAPVPGLPPIQAIAHSVFQVNLSLALDGAGKVWLFGSESTSGGGNATPRQLQNIAPMVDISAEGSPTGLDAEGNAWNLQGASAGLIGGKYGRLGVRYSNSLFNPITPKGFIGQVPNVLWYTSWATLLEGRGVGRLGTLAVGVLPGSDGAVYASAEGLVVKADGTLWKVTAGQDRFEPVPFFTGVALPR